MADSPRARKAFFASHVGLFRSVVEVDPQTAVPNDSPVNQTAGNVKELARTPVVCVLSGSAAPLTQVVADRGDEAGIATPQPVYDVDRRQLSLGPFVLKCFERPAENQEKILKVFQEEGWPARIDDPLSGKCDEPIKRLHHTLDALNKAIKKEADEVGSPYWLKLKTDGTGQGVKWKIVRQTSATMTASN